MRIAITIGDAAVVAFASFIYIRYLSKIGCRDRYILPTLLNHGIVPFRIEFTYGLVLGVGLVLLNNALPLWASLVVFLVAVLPSTELTRRRHNRRLENLTTSAGGSDAP
ncbi:hypothetical protein [Streptomyces sp. NPDC085540]|uniref:hypothetical protein n=1 Tax=Streptomyces sp. NPDC085540 TaxID=3365730 RepID=UPI0037D7EFD0